MKIEEHINEAERLLELARDSSSDWERPLTPLEAVAFASAHASIAIAKCSMRTTPGVRRSPARSDMVGH